MPPRFPVICGPTASGKSDLAIELARRLGRGEVISADAFQIYRGMDIGTGKVPLAQRCGVPHHGIDLIEPGGTDRFTVVDWLRAAERTIEQIRGRGGVPIVAGGTHLYIKALMEGLFDGPPADAALRASLLAMGQAGMREELQRVDPDAASRIHPSDLRRTLRALEVHRLTGKPISALQTQWDNPSAADHGGHTGAADGEHGGGGAGDRVLIGLVWPVEVLNRRINDRVRTMVGDGLVEEARRLWEQGRLKGQAAEALGYKQLIPHFRGECGLDEAVERIKIETRRLGKQQRTWMRRLRLVPGSVWIDAASTPREQWAEIVSSACGF